MKQKNWWSDLTTLIQKADINTHLHVNDVDYEHEITLVIYNDKEFGIMNERSIRLIKDDK